MDKLKILIPEDNLPERLYIIEILISDFLGMQYDIVSSDENLNYVFTSNSGTAVILDSFFGKYKKPLSYLTDQSIPGSLSWFDKTGESIPMIYGRNEFRTDGNYIICGLDIFGSAYYLLSRWEEYVIEKKDRFGRCDEEELLMVKNNQFKRAVVCEYCEILLRVLRYVCPDHILPERQYSPLITHDVDYLFRFGSLASFGQNILGDLINRKSIRTAKGTFSNYLKYRNGEIKDPFDTFDELMDLSEEFNLKSSFYFKPTTEGEPDSTYSIFDGKVCAIMQNIINRGHEVGIHPSKNTFKDEQQLIKEIERIKSFGFSIKGGRQHYLLYDIPITLNSWDSAGLEYDSGLGFNSRTGFRCGVCWPFRVFDFLNQKILSLIEKPLLFMDASFMESKPEPKEVYETFSVINDQVKRHSGLFVLLWHNDNLNRPESERYREVYENIMSSF
jgi:hypothetical protein